MKEKRVVSASLGSSKRNHRAEVELLGCRVFIERIGVDGDKKKVCRVIAKFGWQSGCYWFRGADLYLRAGQYHYEVKDVARLVSVLRETPIVDGGELKDTWEREVPRYLRESEGIEFKGKTALIMSGMDRYGLAEGLHQEGCNLLIGDLPFAVGVPVALRKLGTLRFLSVLMMPVLRRLPIDVLYPTGKSRRSISLVLVVTLKKQT